MGPCKVAMQLQNLVLQRMEGIACRVGWGPAREAGSQRAARAQQHGFGSTLTSFHGSDT